MASRHSSSDTAVNSDANEKESIKSHASRMYANLPSTLPSDIQRADQQLHVLTQCIQSMDQEMQRLREEQGTSEALERIRQRLDALESRVTKHSAMLEEQRRMILDQRQTRVDREGTSAEKHLELPLQLLLCLGPNQPRLHGLSLMQIEMRHRPLVRQQTPVERPTQCHPTLLHRHLLPRPFPPHRPFPLLPFLHQQRQQRHALNP